MQEIISDYEGSEDAAHAPFRPVHRPQRFCHPLPDQLIAPPARGPLKSGQRNGRGRCTGPSTKSVRPLLELPEEQQDGGASLYVSDDSGTFDRAGHNFKGLSGNLSGGWRSAADGQKSRENSGIRRSQHAIKAARSTCMRRTACPPGSWWACLQTRAPFANFSSARTAPRPSSRSARRWCRRFRRC